ncbi:Glycerol-3-phosphate 2-O-acyltransferase [Actinidia chinensis var. chinensis]|uniref:Glycerol-3-phosphate 2-O-acyltransferase n=1 Tax=Actinidia chinensis var. chinensis TaxID=1590841 RepID=A0A2R6P9H8_ACTCC|nr:Glycerol-3-phosphate 2-O-acyltransferase [Actinidia chinensis var. chinensis]
MTTLTQHPTSSNMAKPQPPSISSSTFPTIHHCSSTSRDDHTVVADMDGTLLCDRSSFPYFALVAYEVGGILRLLFLLLASPLAGLLYYLISESAGIRMLIFSTFVGMKVTDIERCVLTANPRVMVEGFLKEYLGVNVVLGTEIGSYKGRATGLLLGPGVLVGRNKAEALQKAFSDAPDIGIGDRKTDFPFMRLCKEAYIVPHKPEVEPVPHNKLPKPIVFHNSRLVQQLTPLTALLTLLWIPVGFVLSCLRIAVGILLPIPLTPNACRALGVRLTVKGTLPPPPKKSAGRSRNLFVCSHRTLLDPFFLSVALGRPIPALTYSLSHFSDFISPIKTVRLSLSRDRATDATIIKKLLQQGDLAICPEGTTCREPFLLRFSALFALTDELVPVAMCSKMSMFHRTTARGWKGMDLFYFFMNPNPAYEVTFLNKLPRELTCGAGKSSHDLPRPWRTSARALRERISRRHWLGMMVVLWRNLGSMQIQSWAAKLVMK